MLLGMLGEYGSHSFGSEISDSDSELEPASNDRTKRHQSLAHQDAVIDSSHTETIKRPKFGTVSDPLDYILKVTPHPLMRSIPKMMMGLQKRKVHPFPFLCQILTS